MKAAVLITKLTFFLVVLLIIIAAATKIDFLSFMADFKVLADLSKLLVKCSIIEVILIFYGLMFISAIFIFGLNQLLSERITE